jgi:RNA polymerase sigma-B factor
VPSLVSPPDQTRSDRNDRVLAHLHLVDPFVRRYAMRGVPTDDLRQIAYLGLVQAAERFDPERGQSFEAFAAVTVVGTIKRYFRDRTWTVRPPRALTEMHLEVRRADEELTHHLGRTPTIPEVAAEVGITVDRLHEALEASSAHGSVSLDAPIEPDRPAGADRWLGRFDAGFAQVESHSDLQQALAALEPNEREIIRLLYVENLTQTELGELLGISQSYVSRVVRGLLLRLRTRMEGASSASRNPTAPRARSARSGAPTRETEIVARTDGLERRRTH